MTLNPAKVLITSGVLALGLSGGVVMAAYGPTVTSTVGNAIAGASTNISVGGGLHGAALFETAATYIGIPVEQLRTELGTDKSLADVAVAHGKTRDGLIQALTAAAQTNIATLVDQKGIAAKPHGGRGGPGGPRAGVIGDQLEAAAAYLGTSAAELRTKMAAGQTLAQIAAATTGKSRDGLVAALTADANAKITAAEQAGTLTAARAAELRSSLADKVARLVDSTRPVGPRGFGR